MQRKEIKENPVLLLLLSFSASQSYTVLSYCLELLPDVIVLLGFCVRPPPNPPLKSLVFAVGL